MPESPDLDEVATTRLVRSGYDAIAEQYLELASGVAESLPRRRQTATLLERLPAGGAVVELRCGAGVPVAEAIVGAGHRYLGIDISPKQIELARRLVPGGTFVVGDVLDQRFPAESFDAALMLYAITQVPRRHWADLARTVRTWLKPEGLFLINAPHRGGPGWLEENFLGFGGTNWTNGYGPAESADIIEAAGFAVLEAQTLPDDEPDGPGWQWILAMKAG